MACERLIICNTSPVINLAEIDLLELLADLPGTVCMAPAVRDELLTKSALFPKAAVAAGSGRFHLLAPEDGSLVRSFSRHFASWRGRVSRPRDGASGVVVDSR